jgi:hypothetical protein
MINVSYVAPVNMKEERKPKINNEGNPKNPHRKSRIKRGRAAMEKK